MILLTSCAVEPSVMVVAPVNASSISVTAEDTVIAGLDEKPLIAVADTPRIVTFIQYGN